MIAEPFMGLFEGKEEEKVEINKEHILASDILIQKDERYFVLAYDFSETVSAVEYNLTSDVYYRVDIKSSFNTKYVGEPSNKAPTNASEIKINGTTLIEVENGKVIRYIEGSENIIKTLKEAN